MRCIGSALQFVDATLRADLLDQLVSGTLWFEPTATVTNCRDASDSKYLKLALAVGASTIVSSGQTCWSCILARDSNPGARGISCAGRTPVGDFHASQGRRDSPGEVNSLSLLSSIMCYGYCLHSHWERPGR